MIIVADQEVIAHTFLNIDDIKNLLSNLEVSVLVLNEIWETILSTYKYDGGDISGIKAEYIHRNW
jgi:hypothetical protein